MFESFTSPLSFLTLHLYDDEGEHRLSLELTKSSSLFVFPAKDCGPLDKPSNGSLFGEQTTYPHEVSFTCDEGFILRGSQLRSCTSEGRWSGTTVVCEGNNCNTVYQHQITSSHNMHPCNLKNGV